MILRYLKWAPKARKNCGKGGSHARDYGYDFVILDTAGRLHIDDELMAELKRITEAVEVNDILLVIDSMVGQDAVNIAKAFNDILEIDGVILTKLDGDTRGGAGALCKSGYGQADNVYGRRRKA